VEAARAGVAGAGFAVVADEVRGLSMRSAEASRRTAEMIETTISKVHDGITIFRATGKHIDTVVEQTHKTQDLIGAIAAASKEQATGIEQIRVGVTEMSKVVQQNAADAEKSSFAAEDLKRNSNDMQVSVETVNRFISGKN
jgi:methyl-accepting chemotaxis protein